MNLLYFNKLALVFDEIDADGDSRVDFDEFMSSLPKVGLELPEAEARQEFELMDSNNGGEVPLLRPRFAQRSLIKGPF